MEDKILYGQLTKRMKCFYDEYFEKAPENRFEQFLPAGIEALPVLLDALDNGIADSDVRTDALIGIGRIFQKHGPTSESLDAVVKHAKQLSQTGFTSERQAALFALGNSRSDSLINSFLPTLESPTPSAVIVGCYLLGYAKWQPAQQKLIDIAKNGSVEALAASTWALGQLGTDAATEALVDLLKHKDKQERAIDALANLGSVKALEPLSAMLTHENLPIRLGAIHGIRSAIIDNKEEVLAVGVDWLIPHLEKASSDTASPVAVFALLTLAELGQKIDPSLAGRILGVQQRKPAPTIH